MVLNLVLLLVVLPIMTSSYVVSKKTHVAPEYNKRAMMESRSLELLITELLKRGRNGRIGKKEDGRDPSDGLDTGVPVGTNK